MKPQVRLLFSLSLLAIPACAQAPADGVKLGDNVTFTATLRARVYDWDWFAPAGNFENHYAYSGNFLRLGLAEKAGNWDFDEELMVPFILGLPTKATAPAPAGGLGLGSNYFTNNGNRQYTAMAFPKQLYARYHFGTQGSQIVQAGRTEFSDGTELAPKNETLAIVKRDHVSSRLISTFGFTDVQRSFDGVRYSWTEPGNQDFTFLAATPTRGVFQTDGWGWNRIGFGYAAYTKDWGHGAHAADTRFFAIDYDDFRHIVKTDNRPAAVKAADLQNIHVQTWGGHSIHVFTTSEGIFDALVWGVAQTGKWGADTQRSWGVDFEGGYQPPMLPALKPWLRIGYTATSGDHNPNDTTHGTFFQLLPTPRQYARTPFFNMMNLQDLSGTLILRPKGKITVQSQFDSLRLENTNDLWYSGGGAYQPWTFGYTGRPVSGQRSLANLYDTSVEYRVNRHMTFTAYYGYLQGLAVIKKIYPADQDGTFGYLEALLKL
jgi:hypothetical protein